MSKAALTGSEVAVVVTTYNRPVALAWVLASLSSQTIMPAQILIADDGSGIETRNLVQVWQRYFALHHPGTHLVHAWQEDIGFRAAAARNMAVQRARELSGVEIIVFIDGDCIAQPFFIENHLALLMPRTMVAGGRGLLSPAYTEGLEMAARSTLPEELVSQLGRLKSPYRLWREGACDRYLAMESFVVPVFNLFRNLRPNDDGLVRTCNLSLWLADFDAVGGFDESFVGWGLEDTEFAVRLISAGVRVRSGRFATNVFHLWHPERSRSELQSNSQRLESTRKALASMHWN